MLLDRGHVASARLQRSGTRAAAVLTALCLVAGCDNSLSEDFGEPGNETLSELEDKCGLPDPLPGLAPPPGTYADQALVIDYARIKSDEPYSDTILNDPRMVEQVYADAVGGNALASWVVCLWEVTSREAARTLARKLASLGCQTIASCTFHPQKLALLRHHGLGYAHAHADRG